MASAPDPHDPAGLLELLEVAMEGGSGLAGLVLELVVGDLHPIGPDSPLGTIAASRMIAAADSLVLPGGIGSRSNNIPSAGPAGFPRLRKSGRAMVWSLASSDPGSCFAGGPGSAGKMGTARPRHGARFRAGDGRGRSLDRALDWLGRDGSRRRG